MQTRVLTETAYKAGLVAFIAALSGTGLAQTQWPVAQGGTGHYYQYVSGTFSWSAARAAAAARTFSGVSGHLATITSAAENTFVWSLAAGNNAWLGGFQPSGSPEPSGGWTWVTGEPFSYVNWTSGNPSDWDGASHGENWLQFNVGGRWNDLRDLSLPLGYMVEFEAQTDISTTAMTWNSSSGGADFQYEVRSSALATATTAKLFWASGTTAAAIIPGAPVIFTQNIPVGASGLSAVIPVPAANLANPPATATHVLLVLDPDNLIQESDEGNNTLAVAMPECVDVILGAVTGPTITANGHGITIQFTPKFGFTLAWAASRCGFDHFNWYQRVVRAPAQCLPSGLSIPFVDPPPGGGLNFGGFADDVPFYWDESGNTASDYYLNNHIAGNALDFYDQPGCPAFQPGDHFDFETSLVGVRQDGGFEILRTWEWSTDYNGSSGGLTVFRDVFMAAEDGTRGGVYGTREVVPSLSIQRSGQNITLSWLSYPAAYTLESTDSLRVPVWLPVSGVTNNSVTIPVESDHRFFRLRQ